LGKWVANRQDHYKKFLSRIHRMIAAVTKAEKEERKGAQIVEKHLLGYDPLKWTETDLQLDRSYHERRLFTKLELLPRLSESTALTSAKRCTKRSTLFFG